jgi:hypothetical protein
LATSELDKKIADFTKKIKQEVTLAIGAQMSDETGQLGVILRQLKNDLNNLRDSIVAERTAKTSSAPMIGEDLELECQRIMEDICAAYSLELTDLRTVAGSSGGKVGDFKISSPQHGSSSICIEVKNRANRISLNAALKELSEACTNRGCEIGIFIAGNGCIPPEASPVNFYGTRDRQIICDPMTLRVALRLAISRATLDHESSLTDSHLNIEELISTVQGIQAGLSTLSAIKANCATIRRTAIKGEELIQELKTELEERTTSVLAQLMGTTERIIK